MPCSEHAPIGLRKEFARLLEQSVNSSMIQLHRELARAGKYY